MKTPLIALILLLGLAQACDKDYRDCNRCRCEDLEAPSGQLETDSLKVFVPNVFSPNGDGLNDGFFPVFNQEYVKDISFSVTDRKSKDEFYHIDEFKGWIDGFKGWDGNDKNGKPLGSRIFAWKLEITSKWGKKISGSGEVLLVRESCYPHQSGSHCKFGDQIVPTQGFVNPTMEKECGD